MEEQKNKSLVLIVILFLLVLGLGGYIVYDKVLSNKEVTQTENKVEDNAQLDKTNIKSYSYNDIKGAYEYTGQKVYDESRNVNITPEYKLYLYENGMFYYNYNTQPGGGKIGNYIINNNTIILNNLFVTNMDVALTVINETNTLKINEDGSLIDNNQPISIVKEKTINLKKVSTNANYQDVQYKIKAALPY